MSGYSNFVSQAADLLILLETITDPTSATPSVDPNFNTILPAAIQYAEQRMYRELDLIQTVDVDTTTTSANTPMVTIPTGLLIVNSLNIITPAGANPDDNGAKRNYVIRTSPEGMNALWNQGAATDPTGICRWWTNVDNTSIRIAPAPNGTYTLEFWGIVRPAALSASNTDTPLTTYIPDVFLNCAMIFFSGYQRDFGAQADDPKLAISWEVQYQASKASAVGEIARMKAQGAQWQPFSKTADATPPRS